MLGKTVTVTVDRLLGSTHPNHPDIVYTVNYGYIEGILAPDGEYQDAYILGINEPIATFTGTVIAVIHRKNDVEEKWVLANKETVFTAEEIRKLTHFQEKYFDIEIIM